ncbi:integrase family protein [Caballeronia arationis]|nr:integrase family protein [Caballeronia arationis]
MRSTARSQTASSGHTAGPSRRRSACASCLTLPTRLACAPANSSGRCSETFASTSAATAGCIWSARAAGRAKWRSHRLRARRSTGISSRGVCRVTPAQWHPKTPLVASLDEEHRNGITGARLWTVMRRFFRHAADVIAADHPALREKLRRASPHWMRHTHATHALARGAELTICGTRRSRRPRSICKATTSSGPGR